MTKDNPESRVSNGTGLSRLRDWLRNPISLVGLVLAMIAFGNILFLFFLDLTSQHPNPYVGILAYMIAPAFLITGLALIPIGIWYDRRRRRQQPGEPVRYLRIDFNDPSQRGALAFIFSFVVAFIGLSVIGSYRAYEFTDSVQFCGQLCHTVMDPEFTAYQLSPHARRPLLTPIRVPSPLRFTICARRQKPASSVTGPRSFMGPNLRFSRTTPATKQIPRDRSACSSIPVAATRRRAPPRASIGT